MQANGHVISLVGAESTGKTSLSAALQPVLVERTGQPWVVVPEYLREWCNAHQRTPLVHEQAEIAATQTQRIQEAALSSNVLADTSALMTAVYSAVIFQDTSLLRGTIAQEETHALTVLCGLDAPWQNGDWQRDGVHMREPVQTALQTALNASTCTVVKASGDMTQRMASVWQYYSFFYSTEINE